MRVSMDFFKACSSRQSTAISIRAGPVMLGKGVQLNPGGCIVRRPAIATIPHRGGADCIPCNLHVDSFVSLNMLFSSLSGFNGPRESTL